MNDKQRKAVEHLRDLVNDQHAMTCTMVFLSDLADVLDLVNTLQADNTELETELRNMESVVSWCER